MKFLSIIVPRFKESAELMLPLFSSINNQVGIDFSDIEVIVVNDGEKEGGKTDALDRTFLDMFQFKTRQLFSDENIGPGMCRQVGIDNARGAYLTFIDADDRFHNIASIGLIISECKATSCDMLDTPWLEELFMKDTQQYVYHQHDVNNTWMHGKCIRRQFLIDNNIKHNPKYYVHEDSYILAIIAAMLQEGYGERRFAPATVTYLWKYMPDSTVRRNDGIYSYNSLPTYINAIYDAHTNIESRKLPMPERVANFIIYIYMTINSINWLDTEEHVGYKNDAEEAMVAYIKKFGHYLNECPQDRFMMLYSEQRPKVGFIEVETIMNWVNRLAAVGKEDNKNDGEGSEGQ